MSKNHRHFRRSVDEHFACRLTATRERRLREHLPGCPECTQRYRRFLLLGSLSPRVATPQVRLGRALGLASPQRRRLVILLLPAFAVAAALVLFARPVPSGFLARGAPASPAKPELRILRILPLGRDGRPVPVANAISKDDELGFTYRNPTGKRRLLVFASDEHGHIYWFHPAWTDPADNPRAIPIAGGDELHELPEVIRHDLDGTELHVQAIFTDEPLSVRDVETIARRQAPAPVHVDGAEQLDIELSVQR